MTGDPRTGDPRICRVAAIDYRLEPYSWLFAQQEADRIDARWAVLRAEKPALFDGRVLIAHGFTIEAEGEGLMRAVGFESGYKPFLCWRDFGFPGSPVFNLFAMGALCSSDGVFMLGLMSAGTSSAGWVYFPAGTPEPSDARDGIVDLEGNLLREMEEETGLNGADVTLEAGWTIVFDGARIACLKRARSFLTADAIIDRFERFRATQPDPELDALVPVRGLADLDEVRMPAFMRTYLRDALTL